MTVEGNQCFREPKQTWFLRGKKPPKPKNNPKKPFSEEYIVLTCSHIVCNLFYFIGFRVNPRTPNFHPKCLAVNIQGIFAET